MCTQYTCACIRMHAHASACVCMHMQACACACPCAYVHACACTFVLACLSAALPCVPSCGVVAHRSLLATCCVRGVYPHATVSAISLLAHQCLIVCPCASVRLRLSAAVSKAGHEQIAAHANTTILLQALGCQGLPPQHRSLECAIAIATPASPAGKWRAPLRVSLV